MRKNNRVIGCRLKSGPLVDLNKDASLDIQITAEAGY
jgi:hypothetical protein